MRAALFIVCAFLILADPFSGQAQTLRARIVVTSLVPARIRIEAEVPAATNSLTFRNAYAGVLGLGERVETLQAINASGESVRVQKLASGEFQANEKFSRFSYEVDVREPPRPAQRSHVSWANGDQGLLMLADLLPVSSKEAVEFSTALITVEAPPGWNVASNLKREGSWFSTDDPANAVFLIGPDLREKSQPLATNTLSIVTSGKWPFSHNDAIKVARQIIAEYERITQFALKRNAVVTLLPFPGDPGPESWSAETRGNDVVLILGRKASGKRVLSRLGIVLSHELFHLWVPNSLRLDGDYDWFFEGFTLYQALRMDLRLGLISFDDYLETIASVYDSYLKSLDSDRVSLLEASKRRWTSSSSLVYEKGMLAAFVYDLSLRNLSDCRASLDDVYRELFRPALTGQGSANEIIIKLLDAHDGVESFGREYIESPGKIDLNSIASTYGLRIERASSGTRLTVNRGLNQGQQKLLGCIGYRR